MPPLIVVAPVKVLVAESTSVPLPDRVMPAVLPPPVMLKMTAEIVSTSPGLTTLMPSTVAPCKLKPDGALISELPLLVIVVYDPPTAE